VKRRNAIETQIAALAPDAAPFQMGSLEREALIATHSMILHELYFASLGGDGKPAGAFAALAREQFGSVEVCKRDFRLTGLSLAASRAGAQGA
jgi:Fe-Mn family superoxide dismutase